MDWIFDHGLTLLGMGVVLLAAGSVYNGLVAVALAIAAYSEMRQKADEHHAKAHTELQEDAHERQSRLQEASHEWQEKHWRERHRHEQPACEVCQEEDARRAAAGLLSQAEEQRATMGLVRRSLL